MKHFRDAVFQLTKEVLRWERRSELQEILNRLDRGKAGSIVRAGRLQLAGYLLYDSEPPGPTDDEVSRPPLDLSDEERMLLRSVQLEFSELVRTLAVSLELEVLASPGVLDPYAECSTDLVLGETATSIFEAATIQEAVRGLTSTPAASLLRSLDDAREAFPSEGHVQAWEATQFSKELSSANPPERLKLAWHDSDDFYGDTKIVRFLASVASLRMSMTLLLQLLYQALRGDRLWTVDRDNTIAASQVDNWRGSEGTVTVQTGNPIGFDMQRRMLFHLDLSDEAIVFEGLTLVHTTQGRMDRESGTVRSIGLQLVDEHLDPRPRIVGRFD